MNIREAIVSDNDEDNCHISISCLNSGSWIMLCFASHVVVTAPFYRVW